MERTHDGNNYIGELLGLVTALLTLFAAIPGDDPAPEVVNNYYFYGQAVADRSSSMTWAPSMSRSV
ncbi:hypothetical protein [Aeromicrobium sp. IC_218]|uniref:hypothetical protein n=1 Tax=Aeromicrobium sp. IC_218 TaxID=2545468 RepID=UPI00103E72BC|nr:hypothetical protein [Aeromicrobium sp. IC_218]TCJ00624.1 hypothetical protein E0W78_00580 [Aeromicrobium sp. IC_218]